MIFSLTFTFMNKILRQTHCRFNVILPFVSNLHITNVQTNQLSPTTSRHPPKHLIYVQFSCKKQNKTHASSLLPYKSNVLQVCAPWSSVSTCYGSGLPWSWSAVLLEAPLMDPRIALNLCPWCRSSRSRKHGENKRAVQTASLLLCSSQLSLSPPLSMFLMLAYPSVSTDPAAVRSSNNLLITFLVGRASALQSCCRIHNKAELGVRSDQRPWGGRGGRGGAPSSGTSTRERRRYSSCAFA